MNGTVIETSDTTLWETEIRAREEEHVTAFLQVNLETLDRLMADGYLVNTPLQRVMPKAELLELLRMGRIHHQTYSAEIESIRRYGDVVVVMGHDQVTDPPDGAISHRRYTNVWRRVDGEWRTIARHAHVVSREVPRPGSS